MTESVQVARSSDESKAEDRRIAQWAACVVAAIAVYIGSIGPAYGLTGFQLNGIETAGRSQRACEIIYRPIYAVCRQSPSIKNVVSSYLGLWSRRVKPSHAAPATAP